jgi:light-harvesting protein B-800-850 alpha chain
MWLVVKPTVGLPLFLASVAFTSLLVHYAVLTHTTWFPAFLNGKAGKAPVATAPVAPVVVADAAK